MPLSPAAQNVAIAALAAQASHLSLHSDVPDAAGSDELSGGVPAYARQSATWNFPSDGEMALAAPVVFDVPAGPVAYVGLWSALVAGDFLGYAPVNGGALRGAAFARAATDDFYAVAHGLVVGDRVAVSPLPGQGLPSGISGDLYFVVAVPTADTFQLATSPFASRSTRGPTGLCCGSVLPWMCSRPRGPCPSIPSPS